MAKCRECGSDPPAGAKFCPSCGTQVGLKKDAFQVSAESLIGKVKEIVNDASVKRVVVNDENGKVPLSIPVTWGAAGAVATITFAPGLAPLRVIASIVKEFTVKVERASS